MANVIKFQTKYSRLEDPNVEKNSGEILVEVGGFIPTARLVEDMVMAGARLDAFRKGMYDYEHFKDDDGITIDPTRVRNVDLADITRMGREVSANLEASKKLAKEQEEAKRAEETAKAEAELKAKIIADYEASKAQSA